MTKKRRLKEGGEAMNFMATEFKEDGQYILIFEAADWTAAQRHCDENGWRLDGEWMGSVSAGPDLTEAEAEQLSAKYKTGGLN